MIRRDDNNILKKAMMLKVNGKRGRSKMTWRRQVEECEGSRVEDRGSCRSNEMEERSESNCEGDEVYPATSGEEEETGMKLDNDRYRCGRSGVRFPGRSKSDHPVHMRNFSGFRFVVLVLP